MGIVNATPDSFSGDGSTHVQTSVQQALQMIADGADILDIGGESTRPDAEPVSEREEIARIVPVIEAVRSHNAEILISIDTMKAGVAQAALDAGANWINDVTGGRHDPDILKLAAERACPIVLMHNRARWQAAHGANDVRAYNAPDYGDFMRDLIGELGVLADQAAKAGVSAHNIVLDPGIGFGKTVAQNLQIIRDLSDLKQLGRPLLVGASRKSFIGRVLDLPPEDRLEGTAAVTALAVANGADILRVHDVRAMRRVADMAYALCYGIDEQS